MTRLALVGAGRMGAVHAAAIRSHVGAELAVVVDVDHEAAARLSDGAHVTSDLDEALGRVDGLVVAAPTPLHPDIAARAIAAGVPILCEKPLSFDVETSERLQSEADAAGVTLAVGFWRRWARPWAHARELIRDGAIGEPTLVRFAQWDADAPPAAFCARDVSGGIFIDCGVHEFELVDVLFDEPIHTIRAMPIGPEDPELTAVGDVGAGLAEITTASGLVGLVDLTRTARYADDVRTEVLGTEGALFVDGYPGGRLRIGDKDGMRVVPGTEMVDLMAGGVFSQLDAFIAAIRGEPVDLADGRSSARATAAGLAAWASVDSGGDVISIEARRSA